MVFKKYVCWKKDIVTTAMDPDALEPLNHYFLATHHSVKMFREDLLEKTSSKKKYDENTLIRDFLSNKNYIFISILGSSGSGKSHLVRWLYANIPQTEKRMVIFIPKADTNLRKIIHLIIKDMKGERFDDYRNRLRQATNSLSEIEARERLLDNIAQVVGVNGPHGCEKLSEEEQYLTQELPNLLRDPFFRIHLLRDHGIIHRLTVHLLGNQKRVERIEERREFTVNDLPLDLTGFQNASKSAQEIYSVLLNNEQLQTIAIDWINKNLDEAIARVLNFSGEDLMALMLDVRESLANQGFELVLLIEDFAKLQAIDKPLLEVLLIRTNHLNRTLCNLRTVIAMTTGYFNRLDPTVKTRIEFRVNLDIKMEEMSKSNDIRVFTARYLNAVRLSENILKEWYENVIKGNVSVSELPNACSECSYIDKCHNAFGSAQGYGLYPFTDTALAQMLERVSDSIFNPRVLIKDVLLHTFENYADSIAEGTFPPFQMLEHFGGTKMRVNLQNELKNKDTGNYQRRQVLLELWSKGEEVINLHEGIHIAFDLPPLSNVGVIDIDVPVNEEVEVEVKRPLNDIPKSLQDNLEQLDEWGNGKEMLQRIAQSLREFLYPAISSRIDWDSELMKSGFFKGGNTKLFQQPGIIFRGQATQWGARGKVQLVIPMEGEELTEVAETLQGLFLFDYHGNWEFYDGSKYLRYFASHIESWAKEVLRQVKSPLTTNEEWDPVPSVTEMLAIGSVMAGNLTIDSDDIRNNYGGIFVKPLEVNNNRAKAWKDLMNRYHRHYDSINEILISRISCTKGGSSTVKIIDASTLINPFTNVVSGKWFKEDIPDGLRSDYEPIKKMRSDFVTLLETAIEEEKKRCNSWHDKMITNLGKENEIKVVFKNLKSVISDVRDAGVSPVGQGISNLENLIERIDDEGIDECLKMTASLKSLNEKPHILSVLGSLNQETISLAERLVDEVNVFFDNVETRVETDIAQFSGDQDYFELKEQINSNLDKLMELTVELRRDAL